METNRAPNGFMKQDLRHYVFIFAHMTKQLVDKGE